MRNGILIGYRAVFVLYFPQTLQTFQGIIIFTLAEGRKLRSDQRVARSGIIRPHDTSQQADAFFTRDNNIHAQRFSAAQLFVAAETNTALGDIVQFHRPRKAFENAELVPLPENYQRPWYMYPVRCAQVCHTSTAHFTTIYSILSNG